MKWVFAFIGYFLYRFPGAISGFFLGSLAEQFFQPNSGNPIFGGVSPRPDPAQFELHLLMLSAAVIKADGEVKPEELRFVRNYFIAQYGEARATNLFKIFNQEIKNETQNMTATGSRYFKNYRYETRLQILHFLFGIAHADGQIKTSEENKIFQIATNLGLLRSDIESIKAMFIKSTDTAYKILEITPHATDAEVKKAYRTMAKKYHPDKLRSQDPAMIKGAKEKFQEVQRAYESIQKSRGN